MRGSKKIYIIYLMHLIKKLIKSPKMSLFCVEMFSKTHFIRSFVKKKKSRFSGQFKKFGFF